MNDRGEKVLVAMSGGVDSSVAAYLLREAGHDVTGVFLCLGGSVGADHDTTGCCSPTDAADARRVAQALGIDLFVLDAASHFGRIIDYFADEYAAGRTPNPCIHCNTLIKFGLLAERADQLGAAYVATGHHARMAAGSTGVSPVDGDGHGRDPSGAGGRATIPAIARGGEKDQSYALFGIPRERLGRVLLPIGEVASKTRVRKIAAELGLNVADKPDSQEICFVEGDYVAWLREHRPETMRPGEIIDSAGNVLGEHAGVAGFTIGQRRGLGVAAGEPMYVTAIDPAAATVTIGPRDEALSQHLAAADANWHIDEPAPGDEFDAIIQIRYNHSGAPGRVRMLADGRFEVDFAEPVLAVTPGQAAVVYQGDRLLGGGWIE